MSESERFFPPKGEFGKAAAPNYDPKPFYFLQTSPEGEFRIPCWSPDPELLAALMLKLLADFPDEVRVLVKVKAESAENADWHRYHGYCSKRAVERAITKFRRFLLRDSSHQFLVRDPDSGEYFALDDYGILWLYPTDRPRQELLTAMGFEDKLQELIYAHGCWTRQLPDSQQRLRKLIDFLLLEDVEASEEQTGPGEKPPS